MRKFIKKSASVISAAALTLVAVNFVPYSEVTEAADELQTRDVWCANEDVNRWESEHFQFIWGKNGADSSKITQSFLEENAKHLEACWDVYMNELSMEPPTQSVNMGLRDGKQYKVNFYISGTGLSPFTMTGHIWAMTVRGMRSCSAASELCRILRIPHGFCRMNSDTL